LFHVPQPLVDYWSRKNKPKATDADIEALERYVGEPLPTPYTTFLRDYGYVVFPVHGPDSFDTAFEERSQRVIRRGSIAFVRAAGKVIRAHERLPRDDPQAGFPLFPANHLPVGGDAGQSQILLELHPSTGRVWFWPERAERWGEPGNRSLGYVAPDFAAFVNGLEVEGPA
jgi:hypothetical protein